MEIIKIGGAVLKSKRGFLKLLELIDYHSKPLIIVISAFSHASRELTLSARTAETGNPEVSIDIIRNLHNQHQKIIDNIISSSDLVIKIKKEISEFIVQLTEFINGIAITRELSPRVLDAVMSFGEKMALSVLTGFFIDRNVSHSVIDSTDLIVTDSNFGKANPLIPQTQENIKNKLIPLLRKNHVVITQGFVARNLEGDITTMGFESSNLTATLLTNLLGIGELTFYTDVEGIRSADPKLIKNCYLIGEMTYEEAYIAAASGLKLIYPDMIDFASQNSIKLIYRSAFNYKDGSTTIKSKTKSNKMIIYKSNLKIYKFYLKSTSDYNDVRKFISASENLNCTFVDFRLDSNYCFVTNGDNSINFKFPSNLKPGISKSMSRITLINFDVKKIFNRLIKLIEAEKILYPEFSDSITSIYVHDKDLKQILNKLHDELI